MPSFIRNLIYALKREYGQKVVFYHKTIISTDLESGKVRSFRVKYKFNRAIVLVGKDYSKFAHDITPKEVGRQFNYGGFFDLSDRIIILDRKDLPASFEVNINDYFIIKNKRYNINVIEEYENKTAYLLQVRQIKNESLEEIIDLRLENVIFWRQQTLSPIKRNISVMDTLNLTGVLS